MIMKYNIEWDRWIKIVHFILIIVLVVTAGLYVVNLMLNMAGAYQAVDDPCRTCEEATGYKCERPYSGNTFCMDGECFEINLTG